mmetsp:Transcript_54093/g.108819  ORF Transcript_54093/g.108819 Transcript_54093/m.108819 type:complete len:330 (+) Transcript_54093:738-1727(+)
MVLLDEVVQHPRGTAALTPKRIPLPRELVEEGQRPYHPRRHLGAQAARHQKEHRVQRHDQFRAVGAVKCARVPDPQFDAPPLQDQEHHQRDLHGVEKKPVEVDPKVERCSVGPFCDGRVVDDKPVYEARPDDVQRVDGQEVAHEVLVPVRVPVHQAPQAVGQAEEVRPLQHGDGQAHELHRQADAVQTVQNPRRLVQRFAVGGAVEVALPRVVVRQAKRKVRRVQRHREKHGHVEACFQVAVVQDPSPFVLRQPPDTDRHDDAAVEEADNLTRDHLHVPICLSVGVRTRGRSWIHSGCALLAQHVIYKRWKWCWVQLALKEIVFLHDDS